MEVSTLSDACPYAPRVEGMTPPAGQAADKPRGRKPRIGSDTPRAGDAVMDI
jgi:hypothetical protein